MTTKKTAPTWRDIKAKFTDFERDELIGLLKDMYTASKDNQTFLNARFELSGDVLKPYKFTINRWLWPDMFKSQDVSIVKAKKAISDYKKAVGTQDGQTELMVYYCEQAIGFANEVGLDDDRYYDAFLLMFEQALKLTMMMPETPRQQFLDRLDVVRKSNQNISGWVAGECDEFWLREGPPT
jgi:hypothetical protein